MSCAENVSGYSPASETRRVGHGCLQWPWVSEHHDQSNGSKKLCFEAQRGGGALLRSRWTPVSTAASTFRFFGPNSWLPRSTRVRTHALTGTGTSSALTTSFHEVVVRGKIPHISGVQSPAVAPHPQVFFGHKSVCASARCFLAGLSSGFPHVAQLLPRLLCSRTTALLLHLSLLSLVLSFFDS